MPAGAEPPVMARAARAHPPSDSARRHAQATCPAGTTRLLALLMPFRTRFNGRERHLRRSFTTRVQPALRHRSTAAALPQSLVEEGVTRRPRAVG